MSLLLLHDFDETWRTLLHDVTLITGSLLCVTLGCVACRRHRRSPVHPFNCLSCQEWRKLFPSIRRNLKELSDRNPATASNRAVTPEPLSLCLRAFSGSPNKTELSRERRLARFPRRNSRKNRGNAALSFSVRLEAA